MSRINNNRDMRNRSITEKYRSQFCARVAALREASGYTQKAMADALGLDRDAYAKYETRSILPHNLILPFCALVGVTSDFLLSGHGKKPVITGASERQSG